MVMNILRSKKVAKRVFWGLLILIVPAFVLWGVGNLAAGPGVIGKINNKKITERDLYESARGIRAQLLFSHYNDFDSLKRILEDRTIINHMAWERLILLNAAKRSKIRVSDSDILMFISQHPLFQRNGMFDRSVYDYILRNNLSMEPQLFEKLTKENIQVSALRRKILSGITATDEEITKAYKDRKDEFVFSYLLIDKTLFTGQASVAQQEIEKYYNENKDSFLVPPSINVEYAEFPYENEEERQGMREKSLEIFKKLSDGGENLSVLAKEEGLTVKQTGPFTESDIVRGIPFFKAFRDAAFSLEKTGDVSFPVFPDSGNKGTAYLLRKIEDVPSRVKTLDEVRPEIETLLSDEKLMDLARKKAEELASSISAGNVTLEEAAVQIDRKIEDTERLTSSSYIENLGPAGKMVLWGKNASKGAVSSPMKVKDGFAIVRLQRVIPADAKGEDFDNMKDSLRADIVSRKQLNAMDEWFSSNEKKAVLLKNLAEL